jgi:4-amino-4-deoxy-L-arabinose transferase-like glycosyltransferase
MTPAVAALAAAGAVELFNASMRSRPWSGVLALGVAATGVWAYVLLRRTPGWNPWLAWTVAALTAVAVLALLAAHLVRMRSEPPDQSAEQSERTVPGRMRGVGGRAARLIVIAGVAGLVAGLAGPAAYAAATAGHRTNGNIPTAGPSGSGMGFPGGGRMPGGARPPAGMPAMGGRMPDLPSGFPGGGTARGGTGGPPGGQGGVNGNVSSGMLAYLDKHRDGAAWLLAVGNSQQAASLILRSGQPVISMFGFTGSDHAMTVQKLQALVKAGKLHYVLAGGGFGGPGGGSSAVTSWVTKNCTAVKPADYGDSSSSAQSLYRCG